MAAFLRIAMIFLLGVGAAAGAYVTGAVDYLSQHHYFLNNLGLPPLGGDVVLRVSDVDQERPTCAARYSIQNRSARRLIIVFSQPYAPYDAGSGGAYGQPSLSDYAQYGYAAVSTPPQSQQGPPLPPEASAAATEVEPGQERLVSALDPEVYGGSGDRVRGAVACMDEPPVTLQLTDCATDAAGICNRTGAAPAPGAVVAPPPGAAPAQGYSELQQGYAAPQQGYVAPQQQGFAEPQQGYAAPQQQGYAEPQQGYAAPAQGYTEPQQGSAAPPQGDTQGE